MTIPKAVCLRTRRHASLQPWPQQASVLQRRAIPLLREHARKLACVLAIGALCAAAQAQDWVPFIIPAQLSAPAWQARPPAPITTRSPRIVVRGEHFYRGGERIRFFGVNCSFGANLPSAEEAPVIAARLAALGLNNVRLHHMDTSSFPMGLWRADAPQRELDEEALRRLDGFVAALAQQGISVDLNLHVGRDFARALSLPQLRAELAARGDLAEGSKKSMMARLAAAVVGEPLCGPGSRCECAAHELVCHVGLCGCTGRCVNAAGVYEFDEGAVDVHRTAVLSSLRGATPPTPPRA